MDFGLVLPIQAKDTGIDILWRELTEMVKVAEQAGFDAVFLPEFHQAHGGALISPMMLGPALLQGTKKIRFGPAVLATPLHHPVRLAEEAIMADWITQGRLVLGLGIGHQEPDFAAYGVDRNARAQIFKEQLQIMERCFSGEAFSFVGQFFDVEAAITPRPYTKPRPPIWIGAHSKAGLERAAEYADVWISDPQRDAATIGTLAAHYRAAADALGRSSRVALFREAWIGNSREECLDVWAPHALAIHRLYYNVGVYRKSFESWVDEVSDRADFTFDRIAPGRFLFGSPGEVRATVAEWAAVTGADYMALRFRHPGGPSHAQTLEAIRRFGSEVISRV